MALYDKDLHAFCLEFHTVEQAIEVVVSIKGTPETIRIEALRWEHPDGARYVTKGYIEQTAPEAGYTRHWVTYGLPDILNAPTANQALRQTLGFLRERVDRDD